MSVTLVPSTHPGGTGIAIDPGLLKFMKDLEGDAVAENVGTLTPRKKNKTTRDPGDKRRDTFEARKGKDPVRAGAPEFAHKLLNLLGVNTPDTTGMTPEEQETAELAYVKQWHAVLSLVISFADDRGQKAWHTIGHHYVAKATSAKERKNLKARYNRARAAFFERIKEALHDSLGLDSADDLRLVFDAIVAYADDVDYRRYPHNATTTHRCRHTACADHRLAEAFDDDGDIDLTTDVMTFVPVSIRMNEPRQVTKTADGRYECRASRNTISQLTRVSRKRRPISQSVPPCHPSPFRPAFVLNLDENRAKRGEVLPEDLWGAPDTDEYRRTFRRLQREANIEASFDA